MLKEALQYVARLATDSQEIIVKDINGETYVKGDARRIPTDMASEMILNSLDSTVDYIKDCINGSKFKLPYVVNIGYKKIDVYSGLNERLERNRLTETIPLLPLISFDQWMDMESFVIQLKTCFVETDNLNKLVAIVSSITDESKVSMEDDGFGLKVSQVSGTTIKKPEEFQINPIVRLAPYRTFTELAQPESRFLLRVRDGGKMALYEADGGMWKLEAQRNASDYLREALAEEIAAGTVVVVG